MSAENTQPVAHLKAPVPPNVPLDRIYDVDMYALDGLGEGFHEAMVPTGMDPPEHTPYRKALDSVLRLSQIRNLETPVRAAAADLIARIAPAGGCEFTKAYAKVFRRRC